MVVCTFYQQNRCRFGGMTSPAVLSAKLITLIDRCKYEHPGRSGSGNSFAALAGGGFQQGTLATSL